MALIQNFSVPSGDAATITFDLSGVVGVTDLEQYTIYWDAYEQNFGIPEADTIAVISKTSLSGHGIDILPSPPMTCVLSLDGADTADLNLNYYHELSIVDAGGNKITPTVGCMTVLSTELR